MASFKDGEHSTDPRRCTAQSSQTGKRCKNAAILGGRVCRYHGGAAPQVQLKAAEHLQALERPAIDWIERLLATPEQAKENGLGLPLSGSAYFAQKPTVAVNSIVANINLDMFLPLHPLQVLRGYGANESDLGTHLQAVAQENGLSVQDDPTPEENLFIRSDQYSFILRGIPSLYLTFGYAPNTPEEAAVTQFMRDRYHGPSDDTKQSVDRQAAAQFNRLMTALARRLADAPQRPRWQQDSFFQRFTK